MGLPADLSPDVVARNVLDSLLEGCQVIGFDWRYLYVNEAVAKQARRTREELRGCTMMECFPGIEATPMFSTLRRCLAEREHARMENEFTYPDGSKGWFELRFIPVPDGACILSLDTTAAKRTAAALSRSEEQVRQMQKMEAVSRLAGGVAHDFNNLLSVVLSYATLLLRELPPADPLRADLEEIKKAGEGGAALTRQLLAFSHQQLLSPQPVDLNEIIRDLQKMIRPLVSEDIEIRTVLANDLGKVNADPGQLEQVLVNLVVNARDAMPSGGRLVIETQNVELDAAYAAHHLGVTPGPHVMVAVSDTGVGMDKATQERIFEPFFTTKETGKGTGLGLATVFGIVRQSGGSVWVYSEPGHGSTFKIHLPRSDEVERQAPGPAQMPSPRGSETLLLVEDDDQLRAVASNILRHGGYNVLDARNGTEALLVCEQIDGPIHLLVTDVIMPSMGGRELAEHALRLRPGLRVLFMSGYTEDAMADRHTLGPDVFLLQKPITPDTLLHKVREVLDRTSGP